VAWTSAATCPLPHRKAETAADRRAAAKEGMMKLSISVTNFFMAVPNQHAARQIGFCRGVSRHHHSRHAVGARSSVAGRPHQQPRPTDAGGIHNARLFGRQNFTHPGGHRGHRRDLPSASTADQSGDDARCTLRRPCLAGLGAGYNDEEAGALGLFMAPVAGGSTG